MCSNRSRREAGFTFAELAFGLLILVITAVVLVNHLAVNYEVTKSERDRVFAFSKAQAILSEIQAYVDRYQIEAVDLDTMDDGAMHKETLSIQQDQYGALVPPDHVVSGNLQRNGQWLWTRRISVQPFAGADNRNVRYVTVHIYHRDDKGVETTFADLSAVINSAGESFPSTQVYDCYLFAIENIPGWWVFMDSIRPFMESMIMDLETRNPGLELRTHWITKASFGRNKLYRPYTNSVLDSEQPIPDVYTYPGRMPAGNASAFYYVPDNIKARINVEGMEVNGYDATENPYPYSLADYFNHAMRYPDELALWNQRVATITQREADIAAAAAGGTTPPAELADMSKEPTLRLFLEDLYSNPTKYKNALLMNLHGELLPMPALRNYSDPAKSQVTYPNLRVVTHPEELRTKRNQAGVTDPLRFRMYAYEQTMSSASTQLPYPAATVMANLMPVPMVVDVMGVDLTLASNHSQLDTGQCTLSYVGGRGATGIGSAYSTAWQAAVPWTSAFALSGAMCYQTQWVTTEGPQPFTRIYLYNTPTRCPLETLTNRGLALTAKAKLYWMDYIPCPLNFDAVNGPQFTPDLTTVDSARPKNTARWTLQIFPSVLSVMPARVFTATGGAYPANKDLQVEVHTRIGTGYASVPWTTSGGIAFPAASDPDNLSVTYAWWADSPEDVPFTERAQFLGDPRYEPYKDCFKSGSSVIADYPNAYNWYMDNLVSPTENSVADYPCIDSTLVKDCWATAISSPMACDTPRFMQLLREGMTKSGIVYTSLTGWSYYYMGIGNDIGYDAANGYSTSIPSSLQPYGGSLGSTGHIDNIIYATSGSSGRNYRTFVKEAAGSNYWWGMPWLGELYPDSAMAQWLDTTSGTPRGNLSCGLAAGQFFQKERTATYTNSTRLAFGTQMVNSGQRAASFGCTTLFNVGNGSGTFQHTSSTQDGTLTAVGTEIASNYNVSVPTTAPISRPFTITAAMATLPDQFLVAPYLAKCTASLFNTYYSHPAGAGSACVKLVNNANTGAAYIVVNGVANTVTNGTSFIAQWNLLTLVHTMLTAGSTTNTFRLQEQPRIEIKAPTDITELNNPATIQVKYGITWRRWDGLPYAQTGTYGEAEGQLQYAVSYSRDGGNTWLHIQDDTLATPGVLPPPAYRFNDLVAGDETFNWDVSVGYPEGTYELRIDCFRIGATVHYAYHRTRLYIQR